MQLKLTQTKAPYNRETKVKPIKGTRKSDENGSENALKRPAGEEGHLAWQYRNTNEEGCEAAKCINWHTQFPPRALRGGWDISGGSQKKLLGSAPYLTLPPNCSAFQTLSLAPPPPVSGGAGRVKPP